MIGAFRAAIEIQGNNFVLSVVPEPATLVLLGDRVLGLLGLAWRRRRRQTC